MHRKKQRVNPSSTFHVGAAPAGIASPGQDLAENGPTPVNLGPITPALVHGLPRVGKRWAKFVQHRPMFGQIWVDIDRIGPTSCELGPGQ